MIKEVKGEKMEYLKNKAWNDRSSKGGMDRQIDDLVNLKMNDLTTG
jgi:hypothetical protein